MAWPRAALSSIPTRQIHDIKAGQDILCDRIDFLVVVVIVMYQRDIKPQNNLWCHFNVTTFSCLRMQVCSTIAMPVEWNGESFGRRACRKRGYSLKLPLNGVERKARRGRDFDAVTNPCRNSKLTQNA